MDAANNRSGARQRDNLIVAGALVGTGLLLKATSQADVRQWEMLPRTTFVIPLRVEPGTHDVTVQFPPRYSLRHVGMDYDGDFVGGTTQTWRNLAVPATGEATYYFRMQRWASGPYEWPPAAIAHQN